jgi:4-hydroxybenzoate polyprenyltransferase
MITTVWGLATALLPAINSGIPITDYHVWLVVVERMLFIFLLALCFDARDVDFDKKDNMKTIPMLYGIERTELLYKVVSVLFFVIISLHYFLLDHYWGIGIAMAVSIVITYFTVAKTHPRKSDYYYMFIVDGMMVGQFVLVWMLAGIK